MRFASRLLPSRIRRSSPRSASRSRGSVVVNTTIALALIIITLLGVELGYRFFLKREFQKAADLAALAGAQQVRAGCSVGISAALANANGSGSNDVQRNLPVGFSLSANAVQCGFWDATGGFRAPTGTQIANAIRVNMQQTPVAIVSFFGSDRNIGVSAVAALGAPIASFSVGSKLITVSGNSSLLSPLLKGIGLDLSGTSLLAYDGLAQAKVTPGGLLKALGIPVSADIGVGELNTLLAGRTVTLGSLLDAIVTAAGQNQLLSANLALLQAIQAKLGLSNLNVQLGTLTGSNGLFAQIIAPGGSGQSALNVGVNALDLIYTAIGVGTSRHAVETGLNIDLLSLAKITTQVTVIEPPSIAIGGIGARAYTAQVRTYIRVKTDSGLLGTLLSGLIKLDLPIVIDVVSGTGEVTDMCRPELQANGKDRANILVTSSLLQMCVGQIAASDLFSAKDACTSSKLSSMELVNVLGLLKVNNKLAVNGLQGTPQQVLLAEGETKTTDVNNLPLGTLVADLVGQISNLLFGNPPTGAPTGAQLDALTSQMWDNTASLCTADTPACRGQRYNSVITSIRQQSNQSGLLTGLLNGVTDLLSGVLNDCTGLLGLGGSTTGCKNMIKNSLSSSSNSGGNAISNALSVLVGLLKPLLNAVGAQVLTPLLQNALGINVGQIDVNLRSLDCKASPMLVY